MKRVYQANDINEANIVSGMLRANGVEAHVGGFYLQGGIGDLAPTNFADVYVDDRDIDTAKSLIMEYEQSGSDDKTPAKKPARSHVIITALLFLAIAAALFVLGLIGQSE